MVNFAESVCPCPWLWGVGSWGHGLHQGEAALEDQYVHPAVSPISCAALGNIFNLPDLRSSFVKLGLRIPALYGYCRIKLQNVYVEPGK